ncbi:MAG: carcinine hydrolase/isopenicillin-N N-acyltransferase family protein [Spirosomaceae bacterium]|jgi:penicillin V acylase-like amidase (Ntn superfamily)|nr:carcinine hydrolase/isopenicillin-N N-acyltransferase family protein [Spirosomataceae bacterium]
MNKPITAIFLFFYFLQSLVHTQACTIFIANDGRTVWVGNNEDNTTATRHRLWYYPAHKNTYGYMTWTELYGGKLLHGLAYLFPQGGMNEHGLFMDYTAIENLPAQTDPAKQNRKKEVVRDVLKKCKSVEEALAYIKQYNLPRLTGAQLFIADATGDYAIVHGSFVERKKTPNFALTNYPVHNGRQEKCWRREAAQAALSNTKPYALDDIKGILERTAQRDEDDIVTNYSMAINLNTRTIHLYCQRDFTKNVVISLQNELKNGKKHKNLSKY